MFQVSDKASEMMKEYFNGREEAPSIRVVLNEGG
jgi:Fe-S cluster assembly iron-binding protein IscA